MSFFESVLHNFNKAAALTGLSEAQIANIRKCSAVYRVKFPVRVNINEVKICSFYGVSQPS